MQTLAPRPTAPAETARIVTGLDRLATTLAMFDVLLRDDAPAPAAR